MGSTVSKDNIIPMLPYTPNSKRKNNLPRGVMPHLVGLIFAVIFHPQLKIIHIEITVTRNAQSVPDIPSERAVSESM